MAADNQRSAEGRQLKEEVRGKNYPARFFLLPSAFLLSSVETLKTSSDFARVRREGRSWASGLVVLNVAPNGLGTVRCGFITGKKIGGAVERNRARRLMKEAVRLRLPLLKPGLDLVWVGRGAIAETKGEVVTAEVDSLLRRARLYAPPDSTSETVQPQ